MIRDEAERLSTLLSELLVVQCPGTVAEVKAHSKRPDFNAPGGARPTFVRYTIRIADVTRAAQLDLDQAQELLDVLGAAGAGDPWGADRLFEDIVARGGSVEPAEAVEP